MPSLEQGAGGREADDAGADDGDYELGARRVEVRDGVARLPGGAVAGSTLTLAAAVK